MDFFEGLDAFGRRFCVPMISVKYITETDGLSGKITLLTLKDRVLETQIPFEEATKNFTLFWQMRGVGKDREWDT